MNRTDFNRQLGARIHHHRLHQKMTLAKLGQNAALDLSGTSIANIEAGRQQITVFQLFCFAKALNAAPGELISGLSGPEENPSAASQKIKKIINAL